MFRLFGFPITIRWPFFLVAVLLGSGFLNYPGKLGIWVAVVFFSILVHELGHAFAGRHMGLHSSIEFVAMGGLTHFENPDGLRLQTHQKVWLSLSGPCFGFGLAFVVYSGQQLVFADLAAASALSPLVESHLAFALRYLLWVNVLWGLLNLLPIYPLDGGQATAALLQHWRPGKPDYLYVSIATAALAIVAAWQFRLLLAGALAFWFLLENLNALKSYRERGRETPLWAELEAAEALAERDPAEALRRFQSIAGRAESGELRRVSQVFIAMLYAQDGRSDEVLGQIEHLRREWGEAPAEIYQVAIEATQDSKLRLCLGQEALATQPATGVVPYLQALLAEGAYEEMAIVLSTPASLLAMAISRSNAPQLREPFDLLAWARHERRSLADYGQHPWQEITIQAREQPSEWMEQLVAKGAEQAHYAGEYTASICISLWLVVHEAGPQHDYNIACSLAQLGHLDEALEWLEQALEMGFQEHQLLREDDDLAPLRSHEGFQSLLQRIPIG